MYFVDKDGFPYPSEETRVTEELCVRCHESIYFSYTIKGEWSHWHGSMYCRKNGFGTSNKAQPAAHPAWAVL